MVEMGIPADRQAIGHLVVVVGQVGLVQMQHQGLLVTVVLERLQQLQGLLFNMLAAAAAVWGHREELPEQQVMVAVLVQRTQVVELLETRILAVVAVVLAHFLVGMGVPVL
jgi:hypothetical protein